MTSSCIKWSLATWSQKGWCFQSPFWARAWKKWKPEKRLTCKSANSSSVWVSKWSTPSPEAWKMDCKKGGQRFHGFGFWKWREWLQQQKDNREVPFAHLIIWAVLQNALAIVELHWCVTASHALPIQWQSLCVTIGRPAMEQVLKHPIMCQNAKDALGCLMFHNGNWNSPSGVNKANGALQMSHNAHEPCHGGVHLEPCKECLTLDAKRSRCISNTHSSCNKHANQPKLVHGDDPSESVLHKNSAKSLKNCSKRCTQSRVTCSCCHGKSENWGIASLQKTTCAIFKFWEMIPTGMRLFLCAEEPLLVDFADFDVRLATVWPISVCALVVWAQGKTNKKQWLWDCTETMIFLSSVPWEQLWFASKSQKFEKGLCSPR